MKIEGNTIIFKSTPDNFYKEREGLKPYTIRRITLWSEMRDFEIFYSTYWKYRSPNMELPTIKIIIINSTTQESFTRTISDISEFGGLWIISWRHE